MNLNDPEGPTEGGIIHVDGVAYRSVPRLPTPREVGNRIMTPTLEQIAEQIVHQFSVEPDWGEAELRGTIAAVMAAAEQRGREEAAKIVESWGWEPRNPQLARIAAAIREGRKT